MLIFFICSTVQTSRARIDLINVELPSTFMFESQDMERMRTVDGVLWKLVSRRGIVSSLARKTLHGKYLHCSAEKLHYCGRYVLLKTKQLKNMATIYIIPSY